MILHDFNPLTSCSFDYAQDKSAFGLSPLIKGDKFATLAEQIGGLYTTFPRKSYISISAPAGAVMAQKELKGLGEIEMMTNVLRIFLSVVLLQFFASTYTCPQNLTVSPLSVIPLAFYPLEDHKEHGE